MPALFFDQTQIFFSSLYLAPAGLQHLANVTPVDALEMDGAVHGMGRKAPEYRPEKGCKFGLRHLTGGHREFAVLDLPRPLTWPRSRHCQGRSEKIICARSSAE